MEKTETGILVVKLSKLWLPTRFARKRNSRVGLFHRKKGPSTTPLCVCVNSYCITSQSGVTFCHLHHYPGATASSATERRDEGWCLLGERWPFSLASQQESHCVCQMDKHFSLPSELITRPSWEENTKPLLEMSMESPRDPEVHSSFVPYIPELNFLIQGGKIQQKAEDRRQHVPHGSSTPTDVPSARKTVSLRKHCLSWVLAASTAKPYYSICWG